ncbi:phosphoribosylaminoimidazole carboxylase ATPase subunit [Ferroplasma acidiphilum]|uniref:N5-carboxyaminoimidazole ribonucleotide synthase n=1 Tax=Ferroplasma acidiphilum TaxID=74969 RepID=A0A1V0N4J8_9ARCH|nr:5-(carboxyamino)imidazole ribonucleotide synthase [Ferroplasma acidiphilum]ARD85025.1 phosphoribosylaminoimidazole carboxylase ATPase subunit [Ferroplasma acidiphilum]
MKVGIIGSGQLGYMMINTMRRYPIEFYVIDDNKGPSAFIADKFFDVSQYKEFVDSCDYVTYEFEHIDKNILEYADSKGKLRPSIKAVELKQDRSLEKKYLKDHGFPIADYEYAETYRDAFNKAKNFGKAVIKSCKGGYDGKNQYFIDNSSRFEEHPDIPYVVEKFIDYEYEASIIAVRDANGKFYHFEPSFNYNQNGILIYNISPIGNTIEMIDIAKKLMDSLEYIGVMGIEYYVVDGKVIINEYAPRVHNTGHHTLTGSSISQFEEHILAVAGMNIVRPDLFVPSGIVNIIGTDIKEKIGPVLNLGNTNIYWYHKNEVRGKRKMGHVNVYGESYNAVEQKIREIIEILYGDRLEDFIQ